MTRRMPREGEAAPACPVHAIRGETGVGKSEAARCHVTQMLLELRATGDMRSIALAVPRHDLGDEQARAFAELEAFSAAGLVARVWRGLEAIDPDHEDFQNEQVKIDDKARMCRRIDAVREVLGVGLNVQSRVCGALRGFRPTCPWFGACSYQKQRASKADVWIVPHELLFAEKPMTFGKLAALVIDESFWNAGLLTGLELPLDMLDAEVTVAGPPEAGQKLTLYKSRALDALRHLGDGPVTRAGMLNGAGNQGLTATEARTARGLERSRRIEPGLVPGMTDDQVLEKTALAEVNREVARLDLFWKSLAALLAKDGPEASGWIKLGRNRDGVRMLRLSGRKPVREGWQVPTLLLDAVLDPELVRFWWPGVEVVADVPVTTPHMSVRQVIDRAYALRAFPSLDPDDAQTRPEEAKARKRTLAAVHARVVAEARRHAPGMVLVVAQKKIRHALTAMGNLPGNVALAHHNAVSGRDQWKDARGIVIIGRTQPRPEVVQSLAEAMTGIALAPLNGWYPRADADREMADGSTMPAEADRHPDPLAERIRWQICEAELVQIIGRGRGVNRTAETPLDVLLMTDVPLPLPLAETLQSRDLDPTPVERMLAAGGAALMSPADASKAYPELWPKADTALKAFRRTEQPDKLLIGYIIREMSGCSSLITVRYQLAGPRHRPTLAVLDTALVPDPRGWLTERLGPLVRFEVVVGEIAEVVPLTAPGTEVDLVARSGDGTEFLTAHVAAADPAAAGLQEIQPEASPVPVVSAPEAVLAVEPVVQLVAAPVLATRHACPFWCEKEYRCRPGFCFRLAADGQRYHSDGGRGNKAARRSGRGLRGGVIGRLATPS